ncbi:hypothetical protein LINGRAPRIM_LOCUS584 [Linum grandiflorum]
MAKGSRRPLTTSRSERLLTSYTTAGYSTAAHPTDVTSELREEDVWFTLHHDAGYDHDRNSWDVSMDTGCRAARERATAGGQPQRRNVVASAPVNVPDWGKILRVRSAESMNEISDGDDSEEMVPPHEYLARAYARSRKMEGALVVEGVGRTLKGRDMRRVRDAVWSQTGFYG